MIIIKYCILIAIFAGSSSIGFLMAKRYKTRVNELREFKEILNILETKIKFTYEPLGEIFSQISKITQDNNISNIFENIVKNLKKDDVKTSWENALEDSKSNLSLNKEDISIIKGIGKFLRQN